MTGVRVIVCGAAQPEEEEFPPPPPDISGLQIGENVALVYLLGYSLREVLLAARFGEVFFLYSFLLYVR